MNRNLKILNLNMKLKINKNINGHMFFQQVVFHLEEIFLKNF